MKLAAFSGKPEDFPAWSTNFVALMHTKGLFRTAMGNDDLPEAEPTLPESPNADQQAAYDTKMQERAVLIQQRKDKRNTVWSHLALVLNDTTLMYIKNDCVGKDGYGDGTKAWKLLQEKFCSVEADGGQSTRSACEAAPRIRGGSRRQLRSQSRADDAVERSWRSNHGHTVQCFRDQWAA